MKHFVFALALFASNIFFCVSAILGLTVTEDGGSNSAYKVYCVAVFVLFMFFYLKEYAGKKMTAKHFVSLLILFVYIISGLFSGYARDTSVLVLVAFGIPASGIAVYYAEHNDLSKLIKWIDVLLPIMTVSLVFSLRQLFIDIAEGEGYYSQTLSYYAAYCLILYLFFILFGNEYSRFPLFQKQWYNYFSLLMLPYLLTIMFFSGGRGAMGTLFVGVAVLLYLYHKRYGIKRNRVVRYIAIIGILTLIALPLIPDEARIVLDNNYKRVFSFFDTSKDMYERTSGRDEVLNVAYAQIDESPIIGHGLFSYKDSYMPKAEVPYPHNIFIEVMLQGGYLFLLLFSVVLLFLTLKLFRILKSPQHEMVAVITVFSLTMLMYSGSYMQNSFFWFFVIYVYNYRFKKQY